MSLRSLLPWLALGVLLASSYANVSMYRRLQARTSVEASDTNTDFGTLSSIHMAASPTDEVCPTIERLGLTSEQRNRIRKCSLSSLDTRLDLALEIEESSDQMTALMAVDPVDSEGVFALAERISLLRLEQHKAWLGSILVVREVLDPEQLELLHALEAN